MNKYYQNTFLFISKQQSALQPLLKSLQWAFRQQIERLDVPLVRMGMLANMLLDIAFLIMISISIIKQKNIFYVFIQKAKAIHTLLTWNIVECICPLILNYIMYQKNALN